MLDENLNTYNLNITDCIFKLIKLSLSKKASSIAIRIDPNKHKIQVVDNGTGLTKNELIKIFNTKNKHYLTMFFNKIKSFSKNIILTSRHKYSTDTFVQVVSEHRVYQVFKGYNRPSKGNTVTIYNFNSNEWKNRQTLINSVSCMISAVAITELEVSFSLCNDDGKNFILKLDKLHSPWEVLKHLKINESSEETHKIIHQNNIDKNQTKFGIISKEKIFDSTDIESCFFSNIMTAKCNIISPLSKWSNWSFNLENQSINNKTYDTKDKLILAVGQMNIFDVNFSNLSQLSVWSDWNYESNQPNIINCNIHNSFINNVKNKDFHKLLPSSVYNFLPHKYLKLLKDKSMLQSSQYPIIESFNDTAFKINNTTYKVDNVFQNAMKILKKSSLYECRITEDVFNSFQILRQINNEFIAAIVNENNKKLLVIVDQHAVHERIRYEWLLEIYRQRKSNNYISTKLKKPLLITEMNEKLLEIIQSHKEKFISVGLNVKKVISSTTCLVDTVPQCFTKKIKNMSQEANFLRLIKNVKQLLMEIADGLAISKSVLPPVLPMTINNVIATEACHGAIKFGDPLNPKECRLLIEALKDTKAPTRCAHGRPSIIPLLDLSKLKKRKFNVMKKLNFGSLKKRS